MAPVRGEGVLITGCRGIWVGWRRNRRPLARTRGWRRGWIALPLARRRAGDLVSFGKHALLIGDIVSSLQFPSGSLGRVTCHHRASKETAPCADCSTCTCLAISRANQGSHGCTHHRSEDCSAGKGFITSLLRVLSADLLSSPLPASKVISLKHFKGFSWAGHNHNTWACRHCCAAGQSGHDQQKQEISFPVHPFQYLLPQGLGGVVFGTTFIQPPGQVLT